jgi:signal transduction histidine kinase
MSTRGAPAAWWAWLTADPRRTDVAVAAATVAVALLLIGGPLDASDTGWAEVAAGVGTFVLVLLRRRWPLPLLAVALGWAVVHALVWDRPSSLVFAALVLLGTACVRLDRGPAVALGTGVGLTLYGLALTINADLEPTDGRAVIGLVWAAAAVGIADAIRSWRRYRDSVDAQARSAVEAAEAHARQQVTEQRLTIARELHDLLAHNMSVMNVQTGAALHLLRADPDAAEQALTAARDAGRTVLDELRDLLGVLRDDSTDHAGAPRGALPTLDDLPALVDAKRSAGLAITWTHSGEPRRIPAPVSLAAYRITQEALTNAAKHGAGTATLTTGWDGDTLTITVTNPVPALTPGRDVPAGGHGMLGMHERAFATGGTLHAGPTTSGFTVHARLPATLHPSTSHPPVERP